MLSEDPDLPAGAQPARGQVLCGRYRLAEKLGSGAFGQVFAADDLAEPRRVAIKVLREGAGMRDPDAVARLRQEAEILEAIQHPNIVAIYEVGRSDFGLFMVMELLEGRSIDQLLVAEGPAEPARVARIARQLLGALAASHAKGVLHRDLKPENIMLARGPDASEDEVAKLVDFGIAKAQKSLDDNTDEGVTLVKTRGGGFMGTPRYCAPEMVVGDPVDARADLFSLGLVLAEWLTGQVRITPERQAQVLGILLQPTPLDVSDCPPPWQAWLGQMIAKNPADRWADALEAMRAFDASVGAAYLAQPTPETLTALDDPDAHDPDRVAEIPLAILREAQLSDTAETEVRELPTPAQFAAHAAHSAAPQDAAHPTTPQADTAPAPTPAPTPSARQHPEAASAGAPVLKFVLIALTSCALVLLVLWLWPILFG